jgi:hypothetical protein
MRSLIRALLIFSVLFFLQLVQAYGQTPFSGMPSMAMGGTGRAAVDASAVAFLNPASMAHVRGYNIAAANRFYSDDPSGGGHDSMLHASENQTDSLFPLAVTYVRSTIELPFESAKKSELHFTMAEDLGKNFALGADFGHYTYQLADLDKETHWDGTLGLMYVPKPNLGLGLVIGNFMKSDLYFLRRNIQLGANYMFDTFLRFAFDVVYPIEDNKDHKGVIMMGIEHKLQDTLPLRIGYRFDDLLKKRYATAGVGWVGPRIGFDYAFEKNLSKSNDYSHSVDVKIYF